MYKEKKSYLVFREETMAKKEKKQKKAKTMNADDVRKKLSG